MTRIASDTKEQKRWRRRYHAGWRELKTNVLYGEMTRAAQAHYKTDSGARQFVIDVTDILYHATTQEQYNAAWARIWRRCGADHKLRDATRAFATQWAACAMRNTDRWL